LVVIASIVSLATNFMNPMESNTFGRVVLDELQFVSNADFITSQRDPAASLKKGELWRVVTPIFPHGNTIHLLFNALAIIQLGQLVERMEGTRRYALLILITAVVSSLLQGLLPEGLFGYPFFGGLSGVVYGVFGFLVVKTYLRPEIGIQLSQTSIMIMLGWLALGFTGQMGPIANMAHLGGLFAGALLAYIDTRQAAAGRKS
jgi:GlpG protein